MSMVKVVGVRFKEAGKIYYFTYGDLLLTPGDKVIVETIRGLEFGEVVVGPKEVAESDMGDSIRSVIRKADEKDLKQVERNRQDERKAYEICLQKIEEHNLPMKLVNVEYNFDVSKIIFYFTADGRVDFRQLVKDLAAIFRTRIELRQIGVRDEAKMLGGIGCCGRIFCCTNFLGDFDPVSIRMAKDQHLSLNPSKISGVCGRLMCCLRFESDCYDASKTSCPPEGARVITPAGEGVVAEVDAAKKTAKIILDDGQEQVFSFENVAEKENGHEDNGSPD